MKPVCKRKNFAGHQAGGQCGECDHAIIAHIGCDSCIICRLESLYFGIGEGIRILVGGDSVEPHP